MLLITNIIRENGIAEGSGAWPIFRGSGGRFPIPNLSVLSVQVRRTYDCSLDEAAKLAVIELQRIIDASAQEGLLEVALFVAHGPSESNSPLALQQSLWTSLRTQYGFPDFSRSCERLIHRSQDRHRKAGIAVPRRGELEAAAPGLRRLRSAALLLVDRDSDLNSFPLNRLFELAFGSVKPAGAVQWGQFVPGCLGLGLLPVRMTGEFDDREVEVDIFASRSILDTFDSAQG